VEKALVSEKYHTKIEKTQIARHLQ